MKVPAGLLECVNEVAETLLAEGPRQPVAAQLPPALLSRSNSRDGT